MTNVIPISRDVEAVSDELVDFQIRIGRVLSKEVVKAANKGMLAGVTPEGLMSLLLFSAASVAGNVMLEANGPIRINVGAAFDSAKECILKAS